MRRAPIQGKQLQRMGGLLSPRVPELDPEAVVDSRARAGRWSLSQILRAALGSGGLPPLVGDRAAHQQSSTPMRERPGFCPGVFPIPPCETRSAGCRSTRGGTPQRIHVEELRLGSSAQKTRPHIEGPGVREVDVVDPGIPERGLAMLAGVIHCLRVAGRVRFRIDARRKSVVKRPRNRDLSAPASMSPCRAHPDQVHPRERVLVHLQPIA